MAIGPGAGEQGSGPQEGQQIPPAVDGVEQRLDAILGELRALSIRLAGGRPARDDGQVELREPGLALSPGDEEAAEIMAGPTDAVRELRMGRQPRRKGR